MRILHVITKLELGGAQQNTVYTCRRLAEQGHDVTLAAGPGGLLSRNAGEWPFPLATIPDLVREVAPGRDLAALRDLTRLVRELRPEVVHTHSSKAGALGRFAAWRGGAPAIVHTVHGWSFSDWHPLPQRLLYRAVEQGMRPLTDHFISVSRLDLEKGQRLHIVPPGRGSVIRSGIDLTEFSEHGPGRDDVRREWGVREGDVLVVDVSCFKPQKAPLDFVAAAALAAREEPSLRFALVGDGVLRPEIERSAREAGLDGRISFPGWRDDIPRILRAADVLALTSLWEGLPRVVVQARATARPVVATSVNGTPEAVVDGFNGILLKPRDIAGFAAAFVRLARDPGLRRRLGEGGLSGLAEFDQDLMVSQQGALYEKLLKTGPRRPHRTTTHTA